MTNIQILTIVIALSTSFLAVLTGVLMNNTRLNDVKEVLRAEIRATHAEMRVDFGELRVLMEKNHSETLARFAELDTRLMRLENERRIVQTPAWAIAMPPGQGPTVFQINSSPAHPL